MDRLSGLSSFGCNADEFAEAITNISSLTATTIATGTVAISSTENDLMWDSCATVSSNPVFPLVSFSCPYCGTHYIARDPGFIPNCHNCNGVMRKDNE